MKLAKNEIRRTGGNGRRSTCVAHGSVLYISGITTVDLEADTAGQARDIFGQLDRLMEYHETSRDRILSATVYLRDMADYGAFNSAWDLWVNDGFEPARSVVGVGLALSEYRVKVALTVALEE